MCVESPMWRGPEKPREAHREVKRGPEKLKWPRENNTKTDQPRISDQIERLTLSLELQPKTGPMANLANLAAVTFLVNLKRSLSRKQPKKKENLRDKSTACTSRLRDSESRGKQSKLTLAWSLYWYKNTNQTDMMTGCLNQRNAEYYCLVCWGAKYWSLDNSLDLGPKDSQGWLEFPGRPWDSLRPHLKNSQMLREFSNILTF